MPLKRTPPPCAPASCENEENVFCVRFMPQYGSAPDLTYTERDNISGRIKRTRDDSPPLMEEIRSLMSASNAKSDAKFTALQSVIAEIIAQNA